MIALPDGLKVYPEDIENLLAAHPRIAALATPQRPELATVIGLEPAGEPVHVHAVFLEPKEPTVVEQIVRETNRRLSQSQQIRGWTVWPDPEFPTTPTQKVKKREVIERLLASRRGGDAPPAPQASGPSRELSEVGSLIAQVANVPREQALGMIGALTPAAVAISTGGMRIASWNVSMALAK